MLDEIDYFLNDIDFLCLNSESKKAFNSTENHLFVGISPFNKYYSRNTILLLAKWCKKYSKNITFFYVGNLARHTLKILKPDYDEKKIQEKLKQQSRVVKSRVMEGLSLVGYTKEESKISYKTFEDIEDNVFFIENLKEILSIYKSEDNRLKNLINNFFTNTVMQVTDENIDSFYTYVLTELAIFKSIKNILNTEESLVVYHDINSLNHLNAIQETFNHKINYLCVNIRDKKDFINYFTDDIDSVFMLNKNFRYKYISKGMLNKLGISEKETVDKTFFEIFGFENQEIEKNDIKVMFEGLTVEAEECTLVDNKVKYFKVIKKPFFNKNKEIIGLIGSSMDITEIKEAQIKAEKEKEYELSFNQNYVHEVNNIFHKKTQIKYLLSVESILEEEKADLLESLEHLENMHFQLMQNFSLHYNNLLQEKEIFLEKKSVNIIKLIEKEIRYFNLCYKYLNQTRIIILKKSLDNFELAIDETKISQVVHNLIKNADKHSESTIINVSLRVLDDICYLSFDDNGIGIGGEIDKESLFIVDKDKKITRSGSGLGLPICKSIVKEHGGDIYFKEVEKGVAIELWLPY